MCRVCASMPEHTNKYLVKPVKIKASGGGPYDGFTLRAYDWKGPDPEIVLPEGKYVLSSETVKKYRQPKGQPREYYDETVEVYRWESA